jgi:hypothetical protein
VGVINLPKARRGFRPLTLLDEIQRRHELSAKT